VLGAEALASLLEASAKPEHKDPLALTPQPDLKQLRESATASLDLRLGTWFLTPKKTRHPLLDASTLEGAQPSEVSFTNAHFVPFGKKFILHPHSFVLAATLEWIRMPRTHAGYVMGKSSWGRRGLVIETAPGVHPGFAGCLTLELANVGEIPIAMTPGTAICQLFIHEVSMPAINPGQSSYIGRRQPALGRIKLDEFAIRLSGKSPPDRTAPS
jgi:dCTP deaminase